MRIMRLAAAALVAALTLAAAPVAAQQATGSPPLVKWGKWALLAGSVGMNLLAHDAHEEANDLFAQIEERCALDAALCFTWQDTGEYLNPETEALYQETLRYDRQARGWLVGGQAALLGAAALFIWEFTRPETLPENIPFEPEVEVGVRETRVGVNVSF